MSRESWEPPAYNQLVQGTGSNQGLITGLWSRAVLWSWSLNLWNLCQCQIVKLNCSTPHWSPERYGNYCLKVLLTFPFPTSFTGDSRLFVPIGVFGLLALWATCSGYLTKRKLKEFTTILFLKCKSSYTVCLLSESSYVSFYILFPGFLSIFRDRNWENMPIPSSSRDRISNSVLNIRITLPIWEKCFSFSIFEFFPSQLSISNYARLTQKQFFH